jgi:hypothetical protein
VLEASKRGSGTFAGEEMRACAEEDGDTSGRAFEQSAAAEAAAGVGLA